ncbi:methionyl-tRNA formyltransferase [Nakamurella leprariae]|uniref:Methionyl-tRNA formyltransferase n=1 Tax=Nakamurella leprariae TaxID=2803911 RepID=A0A938YGK7_9ACTN|nr:methionyl-tRNA formyltransferase [Nakamurella leprariae]
MRIVFAGTPAAAVPSLHAALASPHEVVAVITRPDARTGRGRTLRRSPVGEVADAAGVPVLTPASARTPEFLDQLSALAPQAAAIVAYGALLPASVLAVPPAGWVNVHFSLLPQWRGASPVHAAIRYGDDVTGVSTFRLEEGLDTGPVFGTVTEAVRQRDTTSELTARLAESGARLLVATLDGIADGSLHPQPQQGEGTAVTRKVTVADAAIDWSQPAVAVDRFVRAMTDEPGAWTDSPWGRLVLGPVEPVAVGSGVGPDGRPDGRPDGTAPADRVPPGRVVVGRREVLVGTGSSPVRLGTVTAPGRRAMPAADWARGARPDPDTVLGARQETR